MVSQSGRCQEYNFLPARLSNIRPYLGDELPSLFGQRTGSKVLLKGEVHESKELFSFFQENACSESHQLEKCLRLLFCFGSGFAQGIYQTFYHLLFKGVSSNKVVFPVCVHPEADVLKNGFYVPIIKVVVRLGLFLLQELPGEDERVGADIVQLDSSVGQLLALMVNQTNDSAHQWIGGKLENPVIFLHIIKQFIGVPFSILYRSSFFLINVLHCPAPLVHKLLDLI